MHRNNLRCITLTKVDNSNRWKDITSIICTNYMSASTITFIIASNNNLSCMIVGCLALHVSFLYAGFVSLCVSLWDCLKKILNVITGIFGIQKLLKTFHYIIWITQFPRLEKSVNSSLPWNSHLRTKPVPFYSPWL